METRSVGALVVAWGIVGDALVVQLQTPQGAVLTEFSAQTDDEVDAALAAINEFTAAEAPAESLASVREAASPHGYAVGEQFARGGRRVEVVSVVSPAAGRGAAGRYVVRPVGGGETLTVWATRENAPAAPAEPAAVPRVDCGDDTPERACKRAGAALRAVESVIHVVPADHAARAVLRLCRERLEGRATAAQVSAAKASLGGWDDLDVKGLTEDARIVVNAVHRLAGDLDDEWRSSTGYYGAESAKSSARSLARTIAVRGDAIDFGSLVNDAPWLASNPTLSLPEPPTPEAARRFVLEGTMSDRHGYEVLDERSPYTASASRSFSDLWSSVAGGSGPDMLDRISHRIDEKKAEAVARSKGKRADVSWSESATRSVGEALSEIRDYTTILNMHVAYADGLKDPAKVVRAAMDQRRDDVLAGHRASLASDGRRMRDAMLALAARVRAMLPGLAASVAKAQAGNPLLRSAQAKAEAAKWLEAVEDSASVIEFAEIGKQRFHHDKEPHDTTYPLLLMFHAAEALAVSPHSYGSAKYHDALAAALRQTALPLIAEVKAALRKLGLGTVLGALKAEDVSRRVSGDGWKGPWTILLSGDRHSSMPRDSEVEPLFGAARAETWEDRFSVRPVSSGVFSALMAEWAHRFTSTPASDAVTGHDRLAIREGYEPVVARVAADLAAVPANAGIAHELRALSVALGGAAGDATAEDDFGGAPDAGDDFGGAPEPAAEPAATQAEPAGGDDFGGAPEPASAPVKQPESAASQVHPATGKSLFVELPLPADTAASLALPGGGPAEKLHITALYLGPTTDHPADAGERLIAAVTDAVREFGRSVRGEVTGVDSFPPSNTIEVPYFLSVESPAAHEFHALLKKHVALRGLNYTPTHPKYVAHITVSYGVKPGAEYAARVKGTELALGIVRVHTGGDAVDVEFPAEPVAPAVAAQEPAATSLLDELLETAAVPAAPGAKRKADARRVVDIIADAPHRTRSIVVYHPGRYPREVTAGAGRIHTVEPVYDFATQSTLIRVVWTTPRAAERSVFLRPFDMIVCAEDAGLYRRVSDDVSRSRLANEDSAERFIDLMRKRFIQDASVVCIGRAGAAPSTPKVAENPFEDIVDAPTEVMEAAWRLLRAESFKAAAVYVSSKIEVHGAVSDWMQTVANNARMARVSIRRQGTQYGAFLTPPGGGPSLMFFRSPQKGFRPGPVEASELARWDDRGGYMVSPVYAENAVNPGVVNFLRPVRALHKGQGDVIPQDEIEGFHTAFETELPQAMTRDFAISLRVDLRDVDLIGFGKTESPTFGDANVERFAEIRLFSPWFPGMPVAAEKAAKWYAAKESAATPLDPAEALKLVTAMRRELGSIAQRFKKTSAVVMAEVNKHGAGLPRWVGDNIAAYVRSDALYEMRKVIARAMVDVGVTEPESDADWFHPVIDTRVPVNSRRTFRPYTLRVNALALRIGDAVYAYDLFDDGTPDVVERPTAQEPFLDRYEPGELMYAVDMGKQLRVCVLEREELPAGREPERRFYVVSTANGERTFMASQLFRSPRSALPVEPGEPEVSPSQAKALADARKVEAEERRIASEAVGVVTYDLDGFGDGLSEKELARVEKIMREEITLSGVTRSRRDVMRALVAEGYRVATTAAGSALVSPNGRTEHSARAIGATAMEYAEFLIAKLTPAPPPVPSAPPPAPPPSSPSPPLPAPQGPTVVLSWVEDGAVHDGQPFASDLGQRPKMVPVRVPKAVVWISDASAEDIEKARDYAKKEAKQVHVYPVSESDPLGRAKKEALEPAVRAIQRAHNAIPEGIADGITSRLKQTDDDKRRSFRRDLLADARAKLPAFDADRVRRAVADPRNGMVQSAGGMDYSVNVGGKQVSRRIHIASVSASDTFLLQVSRRAGSASRPRWELTTDLYVPIDETTDYAALIAQSLFSGDPPPPPAPAPPPSSSPRGITNDYDKDLAARIGKDAARWLTDNERESFGVQRTSVVGRTAFASFDEFERVIETYDNTSVNGKAQEILDAARAQNQEAYSLARTLAAIAGDADGSVNGRFVTKGDQEDTLVDEWQANRLFVRADRAFAVMSAAEVFRAPITEAEKAMAETGASERAPASSVVSGESAGNKLLGALAAVGMRVSPSDRASVEHVVTAARDVATRFESLLATGRLQAILPQGETDLLFATRELFVQWSSVDVDALIEVDRLPGAKGPRGISLPGKYPVPSLFDVAQGMVVDPAASRVLPEAVTLPAKVVVSTESEASRIASVSVECDRLAGRMAEFLRLAHSFVAWPSDLALVNYCIRLLKANAVPRSLMRVEPKVVASGAIPARDAVVYRDDRSAEFVTRHGDRGTVFQMGGGVKLLKIAGERHNSMSLSGDWIITQNPSSGGAWSVESRDHTRRETFSVFNDAVAALLRLDGDAAQLALWETGNALPPARRAVVSAEAKARASLRPGVSMVPAELTAAVDQAKAAESAAQAAFDAATDAVTSPFDFHPKRVGGGPCKLCGADKKGLKAEHRKLDPSYPSDARRIANGFKYIKRIKVAFGGDYSDEAF